MKDSRQYELASPPAPATALALEILGAVVAMLPGTEIALQLRPHRLPGSGTTIVSCLPGLQVAGVAR